MSLFKKYIYTGADLNFHECKHEKLYCIVNILTS